MTDGYAINNNRVKENYDNFLKAIEDIKLLVTDNSSLKNNDIIELIKIFANTWLSLDKYDSDGWYVKVALGWILLFANSILGLTTRKKHVVISIVFFLLAAISLTRLIYLYMVFSHYPAYILSAM